jgi:hypothetical protein
MGHTRRLNRACLVEQPGVSRPHSRRDQIATTTIPRFRIRDRRAVSRKNGWRRAGFSPRRWRKRFWVEVTRPMTNPLHDFRHGSDQGNTWRRKAPRPLGRKALP